MKPSLLLLVLATVGCGDEATYEERQAQALGVTLTPVSFSPNPAGLKAYKYVPAKLPAGPVPLVVALHGCTQSAAQFEQGPEWHRAADALGFILLLPEQSSSNNPMTCFNWAGVYGNLTGITRGQGEPASIAAMVKKLQSEHAIDAARIHAVGFSAGAAMVSVLLATYPDLFAGGAIMEGTPYHCADNVGPAMSCMQNGQINNGGTVVDGTPAQWAELVRKHAGFASYWSAPPRVPSVMIWHGTADTTVAPANQKALVKQWTGLHGVALAPSATGKLKSHTLEEWQKNGKAVIQSVTVASLQHAVAIEPGSGADQGGVAGAYVQNVGVYAPYHALKFLLGGATSPAPPPTPTPAPTPAPGAPSVAITSPADGATVSGLVKVAVSASDADGIGKVELYVDGALHGSATAAPYLFSWDASAALAATMPHGLNGASVRVARLRAVAHDNAGNQAKAEVTVILGSSQPAPAPTPVDKTPPTVSISKPGALSNVGTLLKQNPVAVGGSASDDVGVVKVELALAAYPYLSCLGTPAPVKSWSASGTTSWSASLDVSTLTNYRCYRLEARAYDAAQNVSAVSAIHLNVMNTP